MTFPSTPYERLERLKIEADRWIAALSNSNAGNPSAELVASAVRGLRELLDKASFVSSETAQSAPLDKIVSVSRGFNVLDGMKYEPTVTVRFPESDWKARDAFAASLTNAAPQEPSKQQVGGGTAGWRNTDAEPAVAALSPDKRDKDSEFKAARRVLFEQAFPTMVPTILQPIANHLERREDGLYKQIAVESMWRGFQGALMGTVPDLDSSATTENMDERDFRALESLLLGHVQCSDDLPVDERPHSLNARLLFGHIYRLRTAAQTVVNTRTEDFGGPEAERHERALDALRDVCQYVGQKV